ncbi:DNA repair protein SWI5 homolog isoform X2 [Mya arenaria]|nr:DNA repair protein SWI5 homolog isoform X2 [Mya arenaria]
MMQLLSLQFILCGISSFFMSHVMSACNDEADLVNEFLNRECKGKRSCWLFLSMDKRRSQLKTTGVTGHKSQFKSPLQNSNQNQQNLKGADERKADLKKQIDEANKQIQELLDEGYQESELQTHIEKLHEYNEIKDVGQMVLGRLAGMQGVTTRDLYDQYGLNLED